MLIVEDYDENDEIATGSKSSSLNKGGSSNSLSSASEQKFEDDLDSLSRQSSSQ